jgi:TolB-like protein/DNA-binding winged helix-turn-helix (wHTH) protein
LSGRAFDTLLFLAEHPNELIDKRTLLKAVWPNVIVEENNLNQNISLVRRALGDTPDEHRFVVTVPGRGFRFVPVVTRLDAPESTPAVALPSADAREPKASVTWVSAFAVAVALVLGGYFLVNHLMANRATAPSVSAGDSVVVAPSLAVLPFVNMSADKDQEYFSDGLSEELMNDLAQLPGLRVTGRTSSFAFKGRNEDLRAIGQKLGVTNVLEGSVRKSGTHLRITVQLVKCSDGSHVWSDAYDRELDDVFAIQEDIAGAVAKALSVKLGVGTQAPAYGGTHSFEAYDHFLKGRSWGSYEGLPSHAEHLRQAVTIDPNYASAWAQLATLLTYWQEFLSVGEAQSLDTERAEATRRALALAPDLPAANAAEGWHQADQRNWLAAAAAHRHAVTGGPRHDPLAENIVGGFFNATGQVREALPYRERARDADPLSPDVSAALMRGYLSLGMWQSYDAEYKRSQELEGFHGLIEITRLFRLMAVHADPAEIGAQFDRILSESSASELYQTLSKVHTSPNLAKAVLRQHLDTQSAQLYELAQLAGAYGDIDLAIEALRKASSNFGVAKFQYFWYPTVSEARKDPRFKELMQEIGLAGFWRASGKWPDFCHPLAADDFECR